MSETKFRGLNAITSEVLSVHAQREACNTGSELIQTEHLILGILNNYLVRSTAFSEKLDLELPDIVSELARHISPAKTSRVVIGDLPPSQSMLGILGKAANYARESGHELVDVSHILFVSANEAETPFSEMLKKHGVNEALLKASLESFINDDFQRPAPGMDPASRKKSIEAASAVMARIDTLTRGLNKTDRIYLENQISLTIFETLRKPLDAGAWLP